MQLHRETQAWQESRYKYAKCYINTMKAFGICTYWMYLSLMCHYWLFAENMAIDIV